MAPHNDVKTLPDHVRTLVVGAGFAGLAMAIKLTEAGDDDYLVIERSDDVRGTCLECGA